MISGNTQARDAAYDVVGRYRQDDVNGFTRHLLDRYIDIVDPSGAADVLDAMSGDGNLAKLLHDWCAVRRIPLPRITTLEFSRVQAEFARRELQGIPATVVWGDVLSMACRETGRRLPDASFDRVMIKSGNHELPRESQRLLYESVFRVLRPGGTYVNMGFLFDDARERDELREIARCKDSLAGMTSAVVNRHFLLRDEFVSMLEQAGFVDVHSAERFDYSIRSAIVSEQYFSRIGPASADAEFQASQARALTLRRNGRIRFDGGQSVMTCPGEITVARRPGPAAGGASVGIFRRYPMDFLRHVEAHASLLGEAARFVPEGARVLDLGCGVGLLAERLAGRVSQYHGIDVSPDLVRICRSRHGGRTGFRFETADAQSADLGEERHDVAALINLLNLPGLEPIRILRRVFEALRPGGVVVVSGPTSPDSYSRAEPRIVAQLERDGLMPRHGGEVEALREANARLLTARANYWSVEGMEALLRETGFRTVLASTRIYYGHGYLVAAEK